MIIDEDVYIEHYGVHGMKWGRRKTSNQSTKSTEKLTSQNPSFKRRAAKGALIAAAIIATPIAFKAISKAVGPSVPVTKWSPTGVTRVSPRVLTRNW